MATYPVIDQSPDSTRKAVDNIKVEVSADGSIRGQNFYSKTVYQLSIVHPFILEADKLLIESFYDANKDVSFTFNMDADSTDYTLIFKGEPDYKKVSKNVWLVTMNAVGSKL